MGLAKTIADALHDRAKLKEQGFAGADLDKAFEQVVRDSWVKGREWFYLCTACNDTGWEQLECPGDDTCGPSTFQPAAHMPCPRKPRQPHYAHAYVRTCFCAKGQEMKGTPRTSEDFSSATKSKPRKFSRFGSE